MLQSGGTRSWWRDFLSGVIAADLHLVTTLGVTHVADDGGV